MTARLPDGTSGLRATAALSNDPPASDEQAVDSVADLDGARVVKTHAAHGDYVSGNASNTDGTSTQCLAASGAGIKTYLTDLTLTNTSSTNIYVEIKDGTTVKWTFPVPANGGVVFSWKTPIAGSANTAWNFDPSTNVSTVYCSMSGYKSRV